MRAGRRPGGWSESPAAGRRPSWPIGIRPELERFAAAREIEVSSLRDDGALTKPVTIWAVRVDDELYVRSGRGESGGWFRAAEQRHEGRIETDSAAADVAFEDLLHHLDEEIDAAYKAKY